MHFLVIKTSFVLRTFFAFLLVPGGVCGAREVSLPPVCVRRWNIFVRDNKTFLYYNQSIIF